MFLNAYLFILLNYYVIIKFLCDFLFFGPKLAGIQSCIIANQQKCSILNPYRAQFVLYFNIIHSQS